MGQGMQVTGVVVVMDTDGGTVRRHAPRGSVMLHNAKRTGLWLAVTAAMLQPVVVNAADFTWLSTTSSNAWSVGSNWSPPTNGGPDAAGAFVLLNADIAGESTNYLFNTGDAGDAVKTVGRLDLGDANNTHSYIIVPGSGTGILNFDGNGADAQLNQLSTSKGDTFTGAITNTSPLVINNASANTLNLFSVGIGPYPMTLTGSNITFNSSIFGSGNLIINSAGSVSMGPANSPSFFGNIILNSGTLSPNGSSSGSSKTGALGKGTLIINGGGVNGLGNIASNPLTLAGEIWNADWTYGGSKALDMGVGPITLGTNAGTARTLTVNGPYTLTFGGAISNGTTVSSLIKAGPGLIGLNGTNAFTGGLALKGGAVVLGNPFALGTGTFDVGDTTGTVAVTIDSSVANLVISQNNAQNWNQDFTFTGSQNLSLGNGAVTMVGNRSLTASANTLTVGGAISGAGALTKAGTGTLILNGANSYSGGTLVNAGILQFGAGAVPSNGLITISAGGTLKATGAYNTVADWLGSGRIAINSSGVLALTGADSVNADFSVGRYSSLILGAAANATYSGTLTPGANGYVLGGGGAILTISSALNVNTSLTVAGNVTLTAASSSTGPTTVNSGTLTLSGANGTLASAPLTVNSGGTLAYDSSANGVTGATRSPSVTLVGGTLTVSGNSTANSVDAIGGPLTVGGGSATVTVTPNPAKNAQLAATSLVRTNSGVVLFRGTRLGTNTIVSLTANIANIGFSTAPTAQLVGGSGGAGSTTISVLPWASGDTNAAGTGASLVTYDTANGIRPLNISTEYTTTITAGENVQNNVRLTTVVTNSVSSTINGLVLAAGSSVVGTGRLTVASGAILAAGGSIGTLNAPGPGILDFGSAEGVISMPAALTIVGAIAGNNGWTKGGAGNLTLGGGSLDATPNTCSGTTTILSGSVFPSKSNNVTCIPGNVVIYGGALQDNGVVGQLSSNTTMTIYNGSFLVSVPSTQPATSETLSNVYLLGATAGASVGSGSYGGSSVTVLGNTIVSNGTLGANGKGAWWRTGGLTVWGLAGRTNITTGTGDNNGDAGVSVGAGGMTIYQPANGIFGVMNVGPCTSGRAANLYLYGDLVYNGNAVNTNAATISISGSYPDICPLSINTNRIFTVNPGGGPVDLIVAPRISGGVYGITKAGNGTMVLTYTNSSYTGPTIVSAGTLLVNGKLAVGTAVTNYATLGGTGTVNGAVNVIGGTLAPGYLGAGQMMLGSNLTFAAAGSTNATLQVELGGTSAGTGYDQLALSNKTAKVTLANATLSVSLVNGFVPAAGNTFTIVDNQGTNAISGTFAGLPEGRTFMIGQNKLQVSYVGGTGNDIVLKSYGTIPPGTVMMFK